jgi:hypothetical protein
VAPSPVRVSVAQRRALLARRHRLAAGCAADDPVDVARSLVALHSTDPASVFLSAAARMRAPTVAAIEDALYERRALLRMLGMRRTMFVVPVDFAPFVQAACTDAIAVVERRKLVEHLERGDVGDSEWLAALEDDTLAALATRGSALGAQLSVDVPKLRSQLVTTAGKIYGGPVNITTRVLFGLSARGLIVRGRPRGSWVSSQYHWSPVERWLPGGMPDVPADAARAELARRWLASYGPATLADLKWWTGWTMAHVRSALSTVDTVPVDLDGVPGLLLESDAAEAVAAAPPEPWVALLPALDPTIMGWVVREWYLGPHGPALFDRSGNPGPTVWCDGRVVGGWAQRPDGRVVVRLLEDVGGAAVAAIDAAAQRLTEWLDPVRVTPRFRTPLERDLSTP